MLSDKRTVRFSVFIKLSSRIREETRNKKQMNQGSSGMKSWEENKIGK